MRLSYDLTIEQTQKLTMTPELIQAIQILQYTSQELEEFVQNELMENPVLEVDDSKSSDTKEAEETSETEKLIKSEERLDSEAEEDMREKVIEADYDDISYDQWRYSKDDDKDFTLEKFASKGETLIDLLLKQLSLSNLKGKDVDVARYIIDSIDENGYLTVSDTEVCLMFNITSDEFEDILDEIQTFEPLGVGARNLSECLLIQLREKGLLEPSIEYIVVNNISDIADNKLGKISKETGLTIEQVQMIADLIKSLEPRPGRSFSSGETTKYVVPDVILEKVDGVYQVMSNDSVIPHLMISPYYMDLAKSKPEDAELNQYVNTKFEQANWLIRSIEQRKQTIFNVVSRVVAHQMDFFEHGQKYLKTLTLKEIADDLEIHESTVSRSINGKYIQTPKGVFEIRYFFSSGVTDATGEGMSSNSVKAFIKEMIDQENSKKPLSDQDMADMLVRKGIDISRRTVAKYREGMGILSSSKRRRY